MAASQSRHAPAGSLFVGQPTIVTGVEAFIDSFEEIVQQALTATVLDAQNDLRRRASKLDGWRDLSNVLTVSYDYDGLVYSVDGTDEQKYQAQVLEFGDETTAPTAFLRKTASAQAMDAGFSVSRILNQEVPVA